MGFGCPSSTRQSGGAPAESSRRPGCAGTRVRRAECVKHRRSSGADWPRAHRTFCHKHAGVAGHLAYLLSKYVRSGADWCKLAAFLVQGPSGPFSRTNFVIPPARVSHDHHDHCIASRIVGISRCPAAFRLHRNHDLARKQRNSEEATRPAFVQGAQPIAIVPRAALRSRHSFAFLRARLRPCGHRNNEV